MGSQARKNIIRTKGFHKKEKSSTFGSMELPLSSQGYNVNKALFGAIFFELLFSLALCIFLWQFLLSFDKESPIFPSQIIHSRQSEK